MFTVFVREFDCWVYLVKIIHKFVKLIFSMCPDHKYVIYEPFPNEWFKRIIFNGIGLEFVHK